MFTRRLNCLIMSWIAWQAGKSTGGAQASASHLGPEMSREVGYPTQDRSNPEEEAELELKESWLHSTTELVGMLCDFEQLT